MPFIQITYDVPLGIAKGLVTGELTMLGTAAVRDNTSIAAHIREVSRTVSDQDLAVRETLAKGLRNPKVVAIGLGVVVVAAVGGGVAGWAAGRKHQAAAPEGPKCVEDYNNSLSAYLEAIGSGSLNADLLSRLIGDLDAGKARSDSGAIALEVSLDASEALVNLVADYTSKLAEANSVELDVLEGTAPRPTDGPISNLAYYLEVQRQILDQAA